MTRYVLVTGGVISGLGKGLVASSTGMLLRTMGYKVTAIKIDPYINIDAGTMNPFEHGEVFVLDDGGEVDLDLGNYERFMDVTLTRDNNITTGKVYSLVIEKERRGEYLGKTVQIIPHISDAIQDWVETVSHGKRFHGPAVLSPRERSEPAPDFCIIELGGTVGDIESMPFIEAMRQFQFRVGRENVCLIHVSLVPVIGVVGEQKTKPTQMSVQQLRAAGLSPDLIVCRSEKPLTHDTKKKISQFCHVPPTHVIKMHNVSNLYQVPILLNDQEFAHKIIKHFKLEPPVQHLESWRQIATTVDDISDPACGFKPVRIAMVGKYTGMSDSYLSVTHSLQHAAIFLKRKVEIQWIDSVLLEDAPIEDLDVADLNLTDNEHGEEEDGATAQKKRPSLADSSAAFKTPDEERKARSDAQDLLHSVDGVLVPGGFGTRGVEGKIKAVEWARTNNVPFLGICLGLQVAVIEASRNLLGLSEATSTEFNEATKEPVIMFMPEVSRSHMGGTMRLGKRKTLIHNQDSHTARLVRLVATPPLAADAPVPFVEERHRHRYEVNPDYVPRLEEVGLHFVGQDADKQRMEIVERSDHPFFLATQFHPEFKSRPLKPSPYFVGLIEAAIKRQDLLSSSSSSSSSSV